VVARKIRKKRGLPADPDANWNDEELDWKEIVGLADSICELIDDAPGDVWDRAYEFFESVQEKAKDIGETVRRTKRATQGQKDALENMESGVNKWLE
jgi:hypothetical protein